MFSIKNEHREHLEKTIKRLDSSFYYYDLDALKLHLENLSRIMDDDIKLWYACKANPLSAILKVFRNLGFGIDVASKGELDHVLSSGLKPENILSTGPSKSRKYLGELLDNDINIVVCESLNQVYWLNEAAIKRNKKVDVLLRVQLEWEEGTSVLGGNSITPFGEDEKTWKRLDRFKTSNLNFIGLHVFQWGNILDINQLNTIWKQIAKSCKELAGELNIPLRVLDLGGGIGIPYKLGDNQITPEQINQSLKEIKKEFNLEKVWMELGRYAVGKFGSYMSQIIDRKNVRGKEILVLDGGINHIARPALTGQPFPGQIFRESKADNIPFQVHGPLCTALDFLGTIELPEDTNEGDWICFHHAGAYGFTEAMPFFLCHNLPAEVIIYQNDLMTPRAPKTSNDWLV